MEYARNPTALQELMRNHDRALSNLEVNDVFIHRGQFVRLNFFIVEPPRRIQCFTTDLP